METTEQETLLSLARYWRNLGRALKTVKSDMAPDQALSKCADMLEARITDINNKRINKHATI